MNKTRIQFCDLPRVYAMLCRFHPPRTIHDRVDLENVVEITDAMAGHNLTPDQEDYFDLLCRLIEDYEKERPERVVPKATGLEVLRHLMQEHGLSAADLSRLLHAHRTLGAMILRGERQLTLAHVRVLAQHFAVSMDAFST